MWVIKQKGINSLELIRVDERKDKIISGHLKLLYKVSNDNYKFFTIFYIECSIPSRQANSINQISKTEQISIHLQEIRVFTDHIWVIISMEKVKEVLGAVNLYQLLTHFYGMIRLLKIILPLSLHGHQVSSKRKLHTKIYINSNIIIVILIIIILIITIKILGYRKVRSTLIDWWIQ